MLHNREVCIRLIKNIKGQSVLVAAIGRARFSSPSSTNNGE